MGVGRLITASATTGWSDWIHGELWLLPDGILRVALDLERTKEHGLKRTVPQHLLTRSFDDQQISALVASNSRNVWVAADRIARASLHNGIKTDRLKLWLKDGGTVKFLWLGVDQADAPLREALISWGVEALEA